MKQAKVIYPIVDKVTITPHSKRNETTERKEEPIRQESVLTGQQQYMEVQPAYKIVTYPPTNETTNRSMTIVGLLVVFGATLVMIKRILSSQKEKWY